MIEAAGVALPKDNMAWDALLAYGGELKAALPEGVAPFVDNSTNQANYLSYFYQQQGTPLWTLDEEGATTIWERWDGIKPDGSFQDASMNSFNHYAYGAIGEWLYRVVAGIEVDPTEPGYKRILIQPQPGGQLTYVSAGLDSMYGRIESKWMLEDDDFQLAVTIPPNTEGIVHLLAQSVEDIAEQGQALDQVEGIREIRQEGQTVILTLGSGCYHFRVYRRCCMNTEIW